jgi:hypothetical protein
MVKNMQNIRELAQEHTLNETRSPIGERELLALKSLSFDALSAIASQLPAGQRARTAAFCYGKSHLHDLGLAVAACCSSTELSDAFGRNARIVETQAKSAMQEKLKKAQTPRVGFASLVGPGLGMTRTRA